MGQHDGHDPSQPVLALAVDGASDPDLVSDEMAYQLFLRAMATSAAGPARDVALTQAGLDQADRTAFVAALGTLAADLGDIARQRRAGGSSLSPSALLDLKGQEDGAVAAARQRIEQALTAAGRIQLDAHIRSHVKQRIRIYRGPMPAPPGGGGR